MLRIGFDDAIAQTHALEGRTLYLCHVGGEWRLTDQGLQPVASFVPSGERATLVPLERGCRVYLNGQALTAGVSYPLFRGDRVEVKGARLRVGGDGPKRSSRAWVNGLVLFGLFAASAWGLFAMREEPTPVVEEEQAPVAPPPTAPVESPEARLARERKVARRAVEEATGLERVQAFARAAELLQRTADAVQDPELQRELTQRRAELLARATAAPIDSGTPAGPLAEAPAVEDPDVDALEVEAPEVPVEPPAPEPPAPIRVEADPFLLEVDASIERGVRHLTTTPYGPTRPGEAALVAFALLRSGVPPSDPTVEAMFTHVIDVPLDTTYDLAVAILALEARSVVRVRLAPLPGATTVARFERHAPGLQDRDRIAGWAQQLIAGQCAGGDWGYPCPLPASSTTDAERRREPTPDDSNTQFAVLALHAAARSGVEIPARVWRGVLKHYLETASEPKGVSAVPPWELDAFAPGFLRRSQTDPEDVPMAQGWPYKAHVERAKPTLSMTAAGLSSLVIAADALAEAGELEGPELAQVGQLARNAARFLASRFSRRGVPRQSWHYYWLYGLEKAMEVSGVARLADRDWYRAAAGQVVERQRDDGSWGPEIQTSLALLVLNRATLRLRDGTRVRGGGAALEVGLRVEVRGEEVDLPARLEALASLEHPRKELSALRSALRELPEAQRPRLVPLLAPLLDASESATRRFAARELEAITGEELEAEGYRSWGRLAAVLAEAQALDPATEEALREALAREPAGPLLGLAATAATRCQALTLVPELVDALWRATGDEHAALCSALRALCGVDPASGEDADAQRAAAWRAWLRDESSALQQRAWIQAFVNAGPGAVAARAELLKLDPERVVPDLLRAYAGAPEAAWVPALLTELTGLEVEPTPAAWSAAWEGRPR